MSKKDRQTDQERYQELRGVVAHYKHLYHTEDNPEVSDETYDALVRELASLEEKLGVKENRLSEAVGDEPSVAFAKVKHQYPQWSFDNVFNFEELTAWTEKLERFVTKKGGEVSDIEYVVEHKIDGLKLVIEYKNGELYRAATRGDGEIGEDVTHTARTIKTLPTKLNKPVDLICVGEVWLDKKTFAKINQGRERAGESLFANPRNAAAGSLRQLNPEVARERGLSLFAYDVDGWLARQAKLAVPTTQAEELAFLKDLGLPVNPYFKKVKTVAEIEEYYQDWTKKHADLPYGVDGVVIKANSVALQKLVGYTAKSPRFGVAYKFPAVETTTIVEKIALQVGRTGVVTPVAHLQPVLIDGSVVARATLHNEDQINKLDVRVGDTVVVRKAGDIIPEVIMVIKDLRPIKTKPFIFPKKVAGCGGDGSIERIEGQAAYRCVSLDSDFLLRQKLYYFVSKIAFNIDGVGPKLIDALLENGFVKDAADLFTITKEQLLSLPLFKEKAANNALASIAKAREVALPRLLIALSIELVGEETAFLLAKHLKTIKKIRQVSAEELNQIDGVGDFIVQKILLWQKDKAEQAFLDKLLTRVEVKDETIAQQKPTVFAGQSFVFTGTLETLGRTEAQNLVRERGGSVSSSVSKKTTFVVVGAEAGSKAETAKKLGVTILSEADFLKLVETAS